MARMNRKVSVKMYCVVVEVVQPVKRIVISVEAENTAGMFMSLFMVALGCSFECECESESMIKSTAIVLLHLGEGQE